jgi:hypothetical protein
MSASGVIEEDYGLVAVLDALGTRGTRSPEEWRRLMERRSRILADARSTPGFRQGFFSLEPADSDKDVPSFDVKPAVLGFSDTLLLTFSIKPIQAEPAFILRAACRWLSGWYIRAILDGDLYRGAVSIGTFYRSGEIVAGNPVNDAGSLHELADWAGVIVTPATACQLRPDLMPNSPFQYYRWDVPLHPKPDGSVDTQNLWTLSWPARSQIISDDLSASRLWPSVEAIFDRSSRADVVRKKRNTKQYFDAVWNRALELRRAGEEKASRVTGLS